MPQTFAPYKISDSRWFRYGIDFFFRFGKNATIGRRVIQPPVRYFQISNRIFLRSLASRARPMAGGNDESVCEVERKQFYVMHTLIGF